MLCRVVNSRRHFGGSCSLHIHGQAVQGEIFWTPESIQSSGMSVNVWRSTRRNIWGSLTLSTTLWELLIPQNFSTATVTVLLCHFVLHSYLCVADFVTGYESAHSQMPNGNKLRSLGGNTNKKEFRLLPNVHKAFSLLRCYAVYVDSCLPSFRIAYRSNFQRSSSPWLLKPWTSHF